MDRLFSVFFGNPSSGGIGRGGGFPSVTVWECGDNLFVEAELPGVKSDGLDISIVGDELTFKGRRSEASADGQTNRRPERTTGEIARVLQLPVEVDADRANAALNDGVLVITLPKSKSTKPRRVQVKAAK